MKTKFSIVFFFLLTFSTNSYGQTAEYTSGITKFISWISELDDVIANITDKEELKSLDRQLGYASYDISRIAWQKEYLANSISKLTEASENDKIDELKPLVDDLISDIDKLISRLLEIRGKLSQSDQAAVDQIIKEITSGYRNKKMALLKEIKNFLYGEDIPLTQIKEEAIQAKEVADEASKKIEEARQKIKLKLN